MDQNSGGLVDLAAVIDAAARQHHSHAFAHLRWIITAAHGLEGPSCQYVATTVLQKAEHGGLSADKTPPNAASSSAL